MELVERYVYAVTHKLPRQQRKVAEQEVRELIKEKLEKRCQNRKTTYQDVEAVLMELGDPGCFSARYKEGRNYFIGPELYETYLTVMKVVGLSIVIALSVIYAIDLVVSPTSIVERFTSFLVSLITGGVQVFGWITIVFGLLNYALSPTAKTKIGKEKWTPASLQPIPNPKKQIKALEPTAGIIFSVLFMVVFMFYRGEIGIHIVNSEHSRIIIPFFNEAGIREILPYIYIMFGIGILKEYVKLISQEWTVKLFVFLFLTNVVAFMLISEILTNPAIWNPDFLNGFVQVGIMVPNDEVYNVVSEIWKQVPTRLFQFIAAAFIIDTILMLVKIVQTKLPAKEKTVNQQD